VIRNAVLHLTNEQPMLADLYEMPSSTDVALKCTNLRDMNGKRPVFVDDKRSLFFFPYVIIRFIEIPPRTLAENGLMTVDDDEAVAVGVPAGGAAEAAVDDAELEIDEDFLRRIREV
jgi:hypothetical protein